MSDPGPAQLELIRRYARTLRELHADAMQARGPRIGAANRRTAPPEALSEAAKSIAAESAAPDPPTAPAA